MCGAGPRAGTRPGFDISIRHSAFIYSTTYMRFRIVNTCRHQLKDYRKDSVQILLYGVQCDGGHVVADPSP